jgi:hypothetical protein
LTCRQPVEFVKRVTPGPVSQNIAIILDITFSHQYAQIDEFIRWNGKVEYLPVFVARTDNGDQMLAAANALRIV